MVETGKIIILAGAVIVALGVMIWLLGRAGFGGLPGDISHRGENVRFYFPIVTCIVVSVLLTAGVWLWRWLAGR